MTDPNRPCPFCYNHVIYLKIDPETNKYYAECQTCFARGPLAPSGLAAFDLWRTRETSRIATFPSRDAALASPAITSDARALFDQFIGESSPTWALGIIVNPNTIWYLRKDGSYK